MYVCMYLELGVER